MKMPRLDRRRARWIAEWTMAITGGALFWLLVAFIAGVLLSGCAQTLPYCEGESCEQGGAGGAGGSQ